MQLIKYMGSIFKQANKALWFRPYEILITSSSSALIEFMPDTISVNALKKKLVAMKEPQLVTLRDFYQWYYRDKFEEA